MDIKDTEMNMKENFLKTDLSFDNWSKKYQFDGETPYGTFQRIARTLADNEKNPEEWYDKFMSTLLKVDLEGNPIGIKTTPGGRITANIGTSFGKATLMNCFISGPVKNAKVTYERKSLDGSYKFKSTITTPDTADDLVNIFLSIMEQAKTLASEGGYGINFDFIRPRGSIIKGTGIEHPGVVSYMEIWDSVSDCIVKGNNDGYVDKIKNHLTKDEFEAFKGIVKKETRKGAMLGALTVSHPDIEEFIRAKQISGKLTKFNISVGITDEFMECTLEEDGKIRVELDDDVLYLDPNEEIELDGNIIKAKDL